MSPPRATQARSRANTARGGGALGHELRASAAAADQNTQGLFSTCVSAVEAQVASAADEKRATKNLKPLPKILVRRTLLDELAALMPPGVDGKLLQHEYDGERNRKRQPARNLVAAVLDTAARQQEAAARQQERRERPGSPAAAVQRGALRQIMGAAIGPSRAGRHSLCGRTSVSRSSTAVRRYLLCFWWFGFFGVIGYWASPCDQQGT